MQLNFTPDHSDAEKLLSLQPLQSHYLFVVVRCGGYQIIHAGTLDGFDQTGTTLALNCFTEKYRNDYKGKTFAQREPNRKPNGELVKSADKWQYIPIALIERIVDNTQIIFKSKE